MQWETDNRRASGDLNPNGLDGGGILTLDEAAEILKTSYSTVYQLVIDGELRAFRIRNSWRTSIGACNEFVSKRFEEQSVICRAGETR